MDYYGCGSITPVAVKLLFQWLRGLSIRWLQELSLLSIDSSNFVPVSPVAVV